MDCLNKQIKERLNRKDILKGSIVSLGKRSSTIMTPDLLYGSPVRNMTSGDQRRKCGGSRFSVPRVEGEVLTLLYFAELFVLSLHSVATP